MVESRSETITQSLVDFTMWMLDTEQMNPSTVISTLTSLRYAFKVEMESYKAFDNEIMTMARERCRLARNAEGVGQRESHQPEILPLLLDQLDWLRTQLWVTPTATVESKMAYLAIACSYNIVLRVGEVASVGPYVDKAGKVLKLDHRFYLRDISFEDAIGRRYDYEEFRARDKTIPITFMMWTVPTSKSSKQRADGTKYYFDREGSDREKEFFEDLLTGLVLFDVPSMNHPVFSRFRNGKVLELTSKVFAQHLKEMATHFGIDPKHFAGKSTRKGGCQNMAVAGRSDSDTARLARHSSHTTTYKHYVKDVGTFRNVFANPVADRVTVDKLRRTLPRSSLVNLEEEKPSVGDH